MTVVSSVCIPILALGFSFTPVANVDVGARLDVPVVAGVDVATPNMQRPQRGSQGPSAPQPVLPGKNRRGIFGGGQVQPAPIPDPVSPFIP